MRTTLNIPEDALALAHERARERHLSLGDAIGELVRKGADTHEEPSDFWAGMKFLPRRPGQPKVTLEDVNRIRDEEW